MDIAQKNLMESEGLQVVEGAFDFTYKTRIFIRHPDGRLNPYYDYLHEIPMLPNGTEIDLAKTAMPDDELFGPTAIVDAGAITNTQWQASADGQQLIPPVIIGYIILAVILLSIVVALYYLINAPAQPPPCGTEATITEVDDCFKIITMPNCDSRTYNSCTDEWAEDEWHTWTPPPGLLDMLIYGGIAIGAIFIVAKLIDYSKAKQYTQHLNMPPPPTFTQALSSRIYRQQPYKYPPDARMYV